MSDPQSPDLRIGDTEREEALRAFGEHFSAGRLDVDEYGERTAKVTTARTWGELTALFADLPEPHPHLPAPQPAATPPVAVPQEQAAAMVQAQQPHTPAQRVAAGLMGSSWIICIIIYVAAYPAWWIFLVPVALSAMFGSLWGKGWHRTDDERDRYRRRDERRDRRRDRY